MFRRLDSPVGVVTSIVFRLWRGNIGHLVSRFGAPCSIIVLAQAFRKGEKHSRRFALEHSVARCNSRLRFPS